MSVSLDEIQQLTTAEIAGLGLDANDAGTVVFNTDTGVLELWTGTTFEEVITDNGDKHFTFVQGVANTTWNVAHNLAKFPSVQVVDSGGSVVEGDITHTDNNNLVICFTSAFTGKAYLN